MPRVSLTDLKRSTSTMRTASRCPSRARSVQRCLTARSRPRRFTQAGKRVGHLPAQGAMQSRSRLFMLETYHEGDDRQHENTDDQIGATRPGQRCALIHDTEDGYPAEQLDCQVPAAGAERPRRRRRPAPRRESSWAYARRLPRGGSGRQRTPDRRPEPRETPDRSFGPDVVPRVSSRRADRKTSPAPTLRVQRSGSWLRDSPHRRSSPTRRTEPGSESGAGRLHRVGGVCVPPGDEPASPEAHHCPR